MRFKKRLQLPGARRTRAGPHHGSDTPTSAGATLHHTDQKGPNILKGSVSTYLVKRKVLQNKDNPSERIITILLFLCPTKNLGFQIYNI